jgi:hypothetical protein
VKHPKRLIGLKFVLHEYYLGALFHLVDTLIPNFTWCKKQKKTNLVMLPCLVAVQVVEEEEVMVAQ